MYPKRALINKSRPAFVAKKPTANTRKSCFTPALQNKTNFHAATPGERLNVFRFSLEKVFLQKCFP